MPIFTFSSPLWPCDSHNWGGAERDPGGPQRLAWFMAGQPRRRCDLLRFAEHPRCAGRSAEREHVRVARRQDPRLLIGNDPAQERFRTRSLMSVISSMA